LIFLPQKGSIRKINNFLTNIAKKAYFCVFKAYISHYSLFSAMFTYFPKPFSFKRFFVFLLLPVLIALPDLQACGPGYPTCSARFICAMIA
jgi:hypothetical protein